jgi:chromosome segregation protein
LNILLRLKRIELQGFKSFADRTELRFDGQGIVGIVGPNGCGKSNLADAITWVLGEQSARVLRGSRMEDVIFAGTRERKPVSLAQVTMTLAEPDLAAAIPATPGKTNGQPANGKAAPGPRQITITRRLFRSGESEYLIDGRPARLRDIQDIFLGTGLGPDSYAIIEQGRIGQILSSKPQDRRLIIEEAAGVSRFKTRRRLAEAKLEGAKHNLERVFDILEEVGRQMNSLKRQAAKARRYEDLKAQMQAQLRLVLGSRYRWLEREAAKIALDLNLAGASVQSLASAVAGKEQAHAAAQEAAFRTESELSEARQRLADWNLAAERVRGRLESHRRELAGMDERLARGRSELQELEGRRQRLDEEASLQRRGLADLERQAEAARQRLEAKARERDLLQKGVGECERAIESSRQAVLRLLGEAAALRNQVAQLDEYLAAIERDAARAAKEQQAAASDLEWLEAARRELSEKAAARQLELESLADQRRRAEADLAAAREQAAAARREQERLRTEFSELKARRDSLEEILSHRAYTTEAVKRLFTAVERGQAHEFRPLGVLADFVEVDPAWEKAAEEFLHDELEYVVVDCWAQAELGLELLRAGSEGRVTFLVRPGEPPAAPAQAELPADPGLLGGLSDVLRPVNGLSAAALQRLPRLNRCRLVSDRETAKRLALAHPELYFLLPDGVCLAGHALSGGKKSVSGPLALKRELREARAQAQAREQQLEKLALRLAGLEQQIAGLEERLEGLRGAQQSGEKEALALDHERRKLAEEINRAGSRLSIARLELERLERERARAVRQREESEQQAEEKERLRREQEQALAEERERLERLRAEAARCGEEYSAARAEAASAEERRRGLAAALGRVEAQLGEIEARRGELGCELERLERERARLVEESAALEERLGELAGEIAGAGELVSRLETSETERRRELAALAEELRGLRAEQEDAQQKRAQIELELVRRQSELRFLDETSRSELNQPAAELSQGEEVTPDGEALAAAEQKYQELKARIEALGPVNPQALEEYQQTAQRYEFLNEQRQDLLDSIRDTEQAIREIDAETRKRFQEAFSAINAHFQEMFRVLFDGGSAEMRLTDPENLAESGIDIVASPPGKRLQNVLLLSGGEKALAALALLLAIFRFQPSPFCVLDEVDAPLDDPNIDRLVRVLRAMSAQTQFIIITHTKRTMEAAQALYGVTMQEPGVSKLVSVRFQNPPLGPPLEAAERAAAVG